MTRSTRWLAALFTLIALAAMPAARIVCAASCVPFADRHDRSPHATRTAGASHSAGLTHGTTACHEPAGAERPRLAAAASDHCASHSLTAASVVAAVPLRALARLPAWDAPTTALRLGAPFDRAGWQHTRAVSQPVAVPPPPTVLRV